MKKILLSLAFTFTCSIFSFAQSSIKGAETFSVNLPVNYQRTIGANDLASAQWESAIDESFGYIMFENVDELKLAEVDTDLDQFADLALGDFNELNQYKLINSKKFKTKSGKETAQREFSYYDEENDIHFHFLINIYKTKDFVYKMINFGTNETFKKSKKDFDYIIDNIQLP